MDATRRVRILEKLADVDNFLLSNPSGDSFDKKLADAATAKGPQAGSVLSASARNLYQKRPGVFVSGPQSGVDAKALSRTLGGATGVCAK